MRQLNSQFRGKDYTTNVLSFPDEMPQDGMHESPGPTPRLIGELALAYGRLVAEAQDEAKSLEDHLTHLFVHGLTHLFGLDHETDAEAQDMEAAETAILASLGIADPYGDVADVAGTSDGTGSVDGRKRAVF
jgi:probable rRNA maturation factor